MEFAFAPIIGFLVLILPGFIFRRFYYSEEFSSQYFESNLFNIFLVSIIPSVIFQTCHYLVFSLFMDGDIYVQAISIIFFNDTAQYATALNTLTGNLSTLTIYNITLWCWVALLGYFLRVTVRKLKLDRKFKFLRFKNDWHYILTGEFLDFSPGSFPILPEKIEEDPSPDDKVDENSPASINYNISSDFVSITQVDLVMELENKAVIYQGILKNYRLSKERRGVEYLYLSNVSRKFIYPGKKRDEWKDIEGDFLLIPFERVINLNISYFQLVPEEKNRS